LTNPQGKPIQTGGSHGDRKGTSPCGNRPGDGHGEGGKKKGKKKRAACLVGKQLMQPASEGRVTRRKKKVSEKRTGLPRNQGTGPPCRPSGKLIGKKGDNPVGGKVTGKDGKEAQSGGKKIKTPVFGNN